MKVGDKKDTVWNKHVENIGPVSTCADTDTATHTAPHAAISERVAVSNGQTERVRIRICIRTAQVDP